MDDELIKRVIAVGDLFERMLINQIKMEHLKEDQHVQLRSANAAIELVLSQLVEDLSVFDEDKNDLSDVLRRQWSFLDKAYDTSLAAEVRGHNALQAQNINFERMRHKNAINKKAGSNIELKSYGKRHIL